jgi:sugar phosphate permease
MSAESLSVPLKSYRFYQTNVLIALFAGYSGYYICRSNLSVAAPMIISEFSSQGINKEVLGQIASLGIVFYSLGKFINGILGDMIGGRKVFLIGMGGAIVFTIFFGMSSGVLLFSIAWAGNRLIQSMGWGGLVKVTVNWFSYTSYGKVMGFLSLSYLAGDILAKLILGQMLLLNFKWYVLFFTSAALLSGIFIVCFFLIKDKPEDLGLKTPESNPENLFAHSDSEAPSGIKELLLPYFKNFSFILLLIISFGMTALREAFSFWIPTYLYEAANLSSGNSSLFSAWYSIAGIASILGAGFLSDVFLKGKRGVILCVSCIPVAFIFFLMTLPLKNAYLPILFISLIGLLLLGPYSFLAGAMSCDLGGKKGVATAAGLVDSIGYLGGTLALWFTGRLAERNGWNYAFACLAVIALLTAVTAFVYYMVKERKSKAFV